MLGIAVFQYAVHESIKIMSAEVENNFTNRVKQEVMEKIMEQEHGFYDIADEG